MRPSSTTVWMTYQERWIIRKNKERERGGRKRERKWNSFCQCDLMMMMMMMMIIAFSKCIILVQHLRNNILVHQGAEERIIKRKKGFFLCVLYMCVCVFYFIFCNSVHKYASQIMLIIAVSQVCLIWISERKYFCRLMFTHLHSVLWHKATGKSKVLISKLSKWKHFVS